MRRASVVSSNPKRGLKAFAVVALLYYYEIVPALLGLNLGSVGPSVSGSTIMFAGFQTLIVMVSLYLLLRRVPTMRSVTVRHRVLIVLLAFVCISIVWSAFPALTARRLLALLGSCVFAIMVAYYLDWSELGSVLRRSLGITIVVSALAVMVGSQLAFYTDFRGVERVTGIFGHPNALGRAMALAIPLFVTVLLSRVGSVKKVGAGILLVLAGSLLLRTHSVGYMIVTAALLTLTVVMSLSRIRYPARLLAFMLPLLVITSVIVVQNYETILTSIGRDSTLTGRTELWSVVWNSFLQRPWMGHGYSAFWVGALGPSSEVWASVHWQPPNAHNGMLDVLLELGLIGASLVTLMFFASFRRLVRETGVRASEGPSIAPILLAFVILGSLTDGRIVNADYIWVVFVSLYVRLGLHKVVARERYKIRVREPNY